MACGYEAAGLGIAVRRAHGAPPPGLALLRAWAWRALGIVVRDVTEGPDGTAAALWPTGADALPAPRVLGDTRARVVYHPDAPFAREGACREIGRILLGGAGDAEATDFAACLLVHPRDLAAALMAGDWPEGWCRTQGVSADLAARRLVLLGEWIDRADDGDAAALLAALSRPSLRLASGE